MQAVRRWQAETHETVYDEGTGRGALRHLYLRKGFATGQVMVCLVANAASLRGEERLCELLREAVPGLCSVLLNENTQRTNVVLGRKVRTLWGQSPARGRALRPALFALAALVLSGEPRPGGAAVPSGRGVCRAYRRGDAARSLLRRGHHQPFHGGAGQTADRRGDCGGCREKCAGECSEEWRDECGVPLRGRGPRRGDAAAARRKAGTSSSSTRRARAAERRSCRRYAPCHPRRVVYVSCDPATLARDLTFFSARGYLPQEATPADLFPRTAHVETVVLLSKG